MSTQIVTEKSATSSREPRHASGRATETATSSIEMLVRATETRSDIGLPPEAPVDFIHDGELSEANQELKLPPFKSLFIVIGGNALFQLSFFIIVASASGYAEHLGGSNVFAGLTVGIPVVFAGVGLFFINKYDQNGYVRPFNIAYAAMVLGNLLHAFAYLAGYLYLILLGRIVTGFGFTSFMFTRRYCSDSRIVGIRRRTMLASWMVLGQGFGCSAGPFLGGLLYKVGFSNKVFNGYTSPGWVMVATWLLFWTLSRLMFEEVSTPSRASQLQIIVTNRVEEVETASIDFSSYNPGRGEISITASPPETADDEFRNLDKHQIGVIICMCYFSMSQWFVLGGWETNIPIFSAAAFNYSPYQAGNFIALGGIAILPFLLLNIFFARKIQDRVTLATGTALGFTGLVIALLVLITDKLNFASFFVCWFLVALGFNLASTCTLSLLSKQLPPSWNGRMSMAIQYSNYTGRVTGAVLGGAGVKIGMQNYIAIQMAVVGLGVVLHTTLWRRMKVKTG